MYSLSFYWCATTITHTGYGDIMAGTLPERMVAIFTMVIGIFVKFSMIYSFIEYMKYEEAESRNIRTL